MPSQYNLKEFHSAAIDIARIGGKTALNWFGKNPEVERKGDDSPVTEADRKTEERMREEIARRFSSHGIAGEEHEAVNAGADVQWILDPIDGTRSFIHGVPFFTTLVGVVIEDVPVSGVIYAPATEELCEGAQGMGARLNGTACKVRPCRRLEEATFLSTDVTTPPVAGFDRPFRRLLERTRLHRTWGDAYGHMLVATGRADLMFDPVLNLWDAAPLLTILEEAGGVFTDTTGAATITGGNGLSCHPDLLPEVLRIFGE